MKKKASNIKTQFAVGCFLSDDPELGSIQDIFFVKFNTKDEKEALRLASCIVGRDRAKKTLVILGENGDIYEY